ncbi:MAG: hypothetical protein HYR73_00415 [Candidatus Eisenbacteria bacterium]|nr:hypothetical protein [Candidatus Eisenbacteria bacterium]
MRYAPIALALLCALVLFTGLDCVGFTDAREARDARVTRELLKRGEWITPLYGNDRHLEKPIFAYLPEALAMRLSRSAALRDTPVRSRQIRALAALALVLLTAALAARHFGRRAGAWSALVLVSTLGLPLAARTDGTQVFATLLGWLGCAAFAEITFGPSPPRDALRLGAFVALAATLVIAGPLPALWPLGGLALYAWLARDRTRFARVEPLAGLVLMLSFALPWYGAMVDRQGPVFLAAAAVFPYAADPHGAWFMAPLLALSFLVVAFHPWSALMPEAIRHAATGWRFEQREGSVAHFLIASLVAATVPVALYPGAPLASALPALPAAAILCGRLIDHLFDDPARLARPLANSTRTFALIGSGAALLIAMGAHRVPEAAMDLRLLAAVSFFASWLPFLAHVRGMRRTAVALMTVPVALGAPIASLFVVPDMEGYLNTRTVATAMNEHAPSLAPLALIESPPPSLRLYCARNLVVTAPSIAALPGLRGEDGLAYIAFPPARESELARDLAVPLEIMVRSPSLVLARLNPDTAATSFRALRAASR